jgi:hypothetical protein
LSCTLFVDDDDDISVSVSVSVSVDGSAYLSSITPSRALRTTALSLSPAGERSPGEKYELLQQNRQATVRCRELLDENGCLRHEIRGLREEKAGVTIQHRTEHVHKQVQKVDRRVHAMAADTELAMPTIPPLLSPLVSRWKQQTLAKLSGFVSWVTFFLRNP